LEIWELLIRECVRQTFTNLSTAGDGGHLDAYLAQFTPGATLEIPPDSATGHEQILAMLGRGTGQRPPVLYPGQTPILRHFTTNIHFKVVTEQRVETTAYFCAVTALGPDHWGRYFDVFVPEQGSWLLEHRVAKVEAFAPEGFYRSNLPANRAAELEAKLNA
jgi:hypothetical protein